MSRINVEAVAEKVDRERRRKVIQEARRRAARAGRHPGVNSRNRTHLAVQAVREGSV